MITIEPSIDLQLASRVLGNIYKRMAQDNLDLADATKQLAVSDSYRSFKATASKLDPNKVEEQDPLMLEITLGSMLPDEQKVYKGFISEKKSIQKSEQPISEQTAYNLGYTLQYWSTTKKVNLGEIEITPTLLNLVANLEDTATVEQLEDIITTASQPPKQPTLFEKLLDKVPNEDILKKAIKVLTATAGGSVAVAALVLVVSLSANSEAQAQAQTEMQEIKPTASHIINNKPHEPHYPKHRLISNSSEHIILKQPDFKHPEEYGMTDKVLTLVETKLLDVLDLSKKDMQFEEVTDESTAKRFYTQAENKISYIEKTRGKRYLQDKIIENMTSIISFTREINIEKFKADNPDSKPVQLLLKAHKLFSDEMVEENIKNDYLELLKYYINMERNT